MPDVKCTQFSLSSPILYKPRSLRGRYLPSPPSLPPPCYPRALPIYLPHRPLHISLLLHVLVAYPLIFLSQVCLSRWRVSTVLEPPTNDKRGSRHTSPSDGLFLKVGSTSFTERLGGIGLEKYTVGPNPVDSLDSLAVAVVTA